jgi:alkanesulfonate monooxygenase SsuD/methylene tetrahydromethanopterin reductase-like flavin-dependent oxidoreductase (luciferase family)
LPSNPSPGAALRLGIKPGQWGWRFEELTAAWVRIERLGFDVVSCFDHVSAKPMNYRSWDAPTLLASMAGRTQRVALAVDVINVSLRHPFLLAAQLAVAQAASGGRLEVGLGAGSYGLARFDHEAAGVAFPSFNERLARLEGCLRAFPQLFRGESVTDAELGLDEASLGPLDIEPPPLIVGGTSSMLLEIAVRLADGWNAVVESPQEYHRLAQQVGDLCRQLGRTRPLRHHVQVFADNLEAGAARDLADQLAASGATTVVFVLDKNRELATIDRLAAVLLK